MKKHLLNFGLLALAWLAGGSALAQFDVSKVYTIESNNNDNAGKYMQDNGNGEVVTGALNANSYWEFEATGNDGCYYVKNAKTGKYMQKTSEYEVSVKTGDTSVEIYIKNDPAKGATVYGMASTDRDPHDFVNDNTYGANYNGDSGVVQGFKAALGARPNSFWKIIGHSFTNGVCSDNCTEKYQAPALVDGWYELTNAGNVEWVSQQVASGNYTIKCKLTTDIDYTNTYHQPIGNFGKKFFGKFDGQNHRIKNMTLNNPTLSQPDEDGTGFFGCVRVGGDGNNLVEIKNLIIDASCSVTSSRPSTAGLVGRISQVTSGNEVLIENCINEAPINTTNKATAGIVGQINAAGGGTVTIKSCINNGTITTSGLAAAGIISQINDCTVTLNIESCMNFANVTSTDNKNCGGIHGANTNSQATIKIINCGNTGNVKGTTESAAITGWIGSKAGQVISNCWNTGSVTGISNSDNTYRGTVTATNVYDKNGGQGTVITDEMLTSGELCYKLNGDQSAIAWTQTLDGTQEYPLPVADGDQVYKADDTFCDSSVRHYSNYESGHVFGHNINDEIGMCDVCHTQFQEPALVDGWYELKNAGNVEWFSAYVAAGNIAINGKLMNDIDFLSIENLHSPIGPNTGQKYNGTFDGQGFRIKNMIIERPSDSNIGFFGFLRGKDTTKIMNLIMDKSCTIHGYNRIGGITGSYQVDGGTITIENVINEATITAEHQDAGGIFGGHESGSPTIIIKNVLNTGTITAKNEHPYAGALCCYMGVGSGSKIENFVNLGTVNGHEGGNIGRHNIGNVTNLIDLSDTANKTQGTGSGLVSADVASGKLAWYLNNNDNQDGDAFYQTIGTDDYPMPFNSSQQVREANTGNYTNLTVSESAVQIGSAANLNKFAAEVNAGNTSMNAVLTSDVDMSSVTYTPIGNNTNRYHGTFDGSGHKVNLNIDANAYGQGFISIATGGTTVKNLVVTGKIKNAGSKTAGIIAEAIGGGIITIQNCGNEATIEGAGGEVAGVIANNWNYDSVLKLENVYNIGNVSGTGDVSTICACQGNPASVFKNVYNSGSVTGATQGNFVRPSNSDLGTYTNCYSTTLSNDNASIISTNTSAVASGELCAKLGFGFRQNLGSDAYPNFASGHGFVAQIGAAGYTTMFNKYSDVTIPSGIEAFAGRVNDETVTLLPLTGSIAASEPVILRGNAGLYNYIPTTGASKAATNDLLGSDGSVVTSNDSYYALANLGEPAVVGFYQAENDVVIPEGKAYFVSAAAIKGFTFDFDDDDATAIEKTLSNSPLKGENIYNLAGQRLNKMQKGINIVKGRKVLF